MKAIALAVLLAAQVDLASSSLARAEQLSPEDLARKNENGYFTGLPLFAYSTDIGFGGGARAYYYWNGSKADPRFKTTPYLHRIFLQLFAATGGIQYHWLDYDAPRIAGTPYRIRSQLIFAHSTIQNYFGQGNAALAPLSFPGAGGTELDHFSDYARAEHTAVGGIAYSKYDQFDILKPLWIASIERLFHKDHVRVLGGIGLAYTRIRDYTGTQVDALDDAGAKVTATEATTRLREDCDAGKLIGCDGGREGWLRFGLSYDTRDFEPDPNRGVFIDTAIDAATVALGSEFNYLRWLTAARGYWSPIPATADLVLAGRGMIELQSKGTPFFALDGLPFTEDFHNGLGGHRTLRGYRQDRFVGRTMAAVNGEVRWTFTRFVVKRQKLALIAVPFVDIGRSFDNVHALTLDDWRTSIGGALRISWNLATIVTIDYGRSSEDTGFYVNFGHIF